MTSPPDGDATGLVDRQDGTAPGSDGVGASDGGPSVDGQSESTRPPVDLVEPTRDADAAEEDRRSSRARVKAVTNVEPRGEFDHDKIRRAVRLLLEAIGEDPDREGLAETPDRIAREYDEIFAGLLVDPEDVISAVFAEGHDEIVMMRDIPFYSQCEHHLLPWFGHAHVAYLPNEDGAITGLSKLARVVDVCAKRPGVQERMTTMVADAIESKLDPRGVMVVVEARHLCMEMRGIRKPGAETVTSAVRGRFRDDPKTRAEAFSLLAGR
ncbi:GTP cyclohydrolase I FolE [Salsipaludibacter albus]|uniref:GTP cyclohydrolase I FolE n=1 Tax=Salsipaludibacter albus TaxID=2849650 RepID=UPI001EE46ED8|nr:GTP cyclohydrolase I FolE [Salsipaludibacter albus]MBY5161149.1 GTP cyclohydrolase I FolE [Salsipaludibacter albus]